MKIFHKNNIPLLLVSIVYIALTALCLNNFYFWDNIQQISKEAHWFYISNFKSLFITPQNNAYDITATGYHPPLMGIMTALLWKVVGYKLWISHIFVFVWAIVLIYNLKRVLSFIFDDKYINWILAIILLESALLSQFAIASPDFILFTAFIVSLRAIIERKNILLTIGIFFLCCINMRGLFVGTILFIAHNYYNWQINEKRYKLKTLFQTLLPYIPTILLLMAYYSAYFIINGWFFKDSANSGHYALPSNMGQVIRHFAEFALRSIENGRIIIWVLGIFTAIKLFKTRPNLSPILKTFLLIFFFLTGIYVIFIFISQMPFSTRYFMPQFFLLTVIALFGTIKYLKNRIKLVFAIVLIFELTGHFWIYPRTVAKSWDCTLAHLPFYNLRNECFEFIDTMELDYNDISAGFCLYGKRRYIELKNDDREISSGSDRKYFIYSNISNIEDDLGIELMYQNKWTLIKEFKEGFVCIELYENKLHNANNQ